MPPPVLSHARTPQGGSRVATPPRRVPRDGLRHELRSRYVTLIAETVHGLDLTPAARSHVATRFAAALAWNEGDEFDRARFVRECDPYGRAKLEQRS